jgi:phosphate transport system substrate-binding protein
MSLNRRPWLAAVLLLGAVACKETGPVHAPSTEPGTVAPATGEARPAETPRAVKQLLGAGATFPFPIYARWGSEYNKQTGVQLNYQSIGSGGGIQQIKNKTVDFGASDAPMKPEELEKAGLVQFPMVLGGVVPVVHLSGITANQLTLDGSTLAGLYLGDIKTWNDPKIAALNPGVALPATAVTPVYRADGSGTTWIFTHYLSKVSPDWKAKVGNDKTVQWPAGVGGKGNEGVAAYVQRVDGSLGYVEFAYAVQNKLASVKLKNAAGQVVEPGIPTFQAAAASADWANAPGFHVVLTDQPGADSWPIAGASFLLVYAAQADRAKAEAMLKFFDFSLRKGADTARSLQYVPLPPAVVELVEQAWTRQVSAGGKPVWDATMATR